MRWTIPTLMQQLADAGLPNHVAADIVVATYPETHGDTFYRWADTAAPEKIAVGVYAIWNSLRGDQSPLGGTKVSDDARTIAQFWRLNRRDQFASVRVTDKPDYVIRRIADGVMSAWGEGDYFHPREVEPDRDPAGRIAEIQSSLRRLDGSADYIASIPPPRFY